MSIAYSATLQSVLEKAKKYNGSVSAEAFVAAAIETFKQNEQNCDIISDMYGAIEKLCEKHIDLVKLCDALSDIATRCDIYDSLNFKKTIMVASMSAEKAGLDCLTTEHVLAAVFDDPTERIAALLNSTEAADRCQHEDCDEALDSADGESGGAAEAPAGFDPARAFSGLFDAAAAAVSEVSDQDELSAAGYGAHVDGAVAGEGGYGAPRSTSDEASAPAHGSAPERPTFGADALGQSAGKAFQTGNASDISRLVDSVKVMQDKLLSTVYGQDNAVSVFCSGYFQAEMLDMTDKNRYRPKATFLFAGPPGVGKTFLAESVASLLGLPYVRFDMSEYSDKEANIEFAGSDSVYKNSSSGNVTSFVAEHPKCVLLFDEIEKAHLCVIHLFLQILDAGRLRDNCTDQEVSFKDAIIIFTTNAGKQLYEDSETYDYSSLSRKVILSALAKDKKPESDAPLFPAAICSRFASGNVVMFNHITADNLRAIAKKEIVRHIGNFTDRFGISIDIDESVYTTLLFAEGGNADARMIRSRAEMFINGELYELFRLITSGKTGTSIENIKTIHIGVELPGDREISGLYTSEAKPQVLIFAAPEVAKRCAEMAPDCDFVGADSLESAREMLKECDITFAMLDITYGIGSGRHDLLNIEDVDSAARDFFKFVKEYYPELPIYIIDTADSNISDAERVSFTRAGMRGIVSLSDSDEFNNTIAAICERDYQQKSMNDLARSNKVVSYETEQFISGYGTRAEIMLFDLALTTAVAAEDSKSVISDISRPNVRFDQVIGADDAKGELQYFVEYLRNPKKYKGTGVRAPKGVLLYGPPGTGKTMLAKAMACESGATFIAAEGNQFITKYQGEGIELVHDLFRRARRYAPSILFIDEIDAIAKERSGADNNTSIEAALTAFLTEMDGFKSDPTRPVFVLAATNFDVEPGSQRSLDAALMRRFDRRVLIDLPDKNSRIKYLRSRMSANKAFVMSEKEIESIAMRSTGMSLAELESVMEMALRSAIRSGSIQVTDEIFEDAFETFNSGETKKWDISQLERVARHESGHAFICWQSGETPSYLTIVARGDHGGYMQHADNEGKAIYTRDELKARIRTSLGGRAAEIVYYGTDDGVSTGASGDLVSATRMAERMLCTYGMDEAFGLAAIDPHSSDAAAENVRQCVNLVLKHELDVAIEAISQNRQVIDRMVDILMVKNHLSAGEIDRIFRGESID